MVSPRFRHSFNRRRFEGVFLASGALFALALFVAVAVSIALRIPWGALVALGLAFLIIASGLAVSLEKRKGARGFVPAHQSP